MPRDKIMQVRVDLSTLNRWRARARELDLGTSSWVRLACACLERWQDEMPGLKGGDPRLPNFPREKP